MIEAKLQVRLTYLHNGIWRLEVDTIDFQGALNNCVEQLQKYLFEAQDLLLKYESLIQL